MTAPDSRHPLRRAVALVLLFTALCFGVAGGYWLSGNVMMFAGINFFWSLIFLLFAFLLDMPASTRQAIWNLGWKRLAAIVCGIIAVCDLIVAGYWFAQNAFHWMTLNLIGVVFFGFIALALWAFSRDPKNSA